MLLPSRRRAFTAPGQAFALAHELCAGAKKENCAQRFVAGALLGAAFAVLAGCQGAGQTGSLKAAAIAPQSQQIESTAPKTDAQSAGLADDTAPPDASLITGSVQKAEKTDPAATATSDVVERYQPPKPGTVFSWRNNWASLPPLISYKVDGPEKIGDTEYIKFTSVGGLKETTHAYYSAQSFALKGYRDAADRAIVTFKPVEERYRFPMKPGDKWVTSWKSIEHRGNKESQGGGIVRVIGFETLRLPAGSFRALKVQMPLQDRELAGARHYVWFAPELGITVKELILNGNSSWTQVLEDITPG